jgi:hypothetical protein
MHVLSLGPRPLPAGKRHCIKTHTKSARARRGDKRALRGGDVPEALPQFLALRRERKRLIRMAGGKLSGITIQRHPEG